MTNASGGALKEGGPSVNLGDQKFEAGAHTAAKTGRLEQEGEGLAGKENTKKCKETVGFTGAQ